MNPRAKASTLLRAPELAHSHGAFALGEIPADRVSLTPCSAAVAATNELARLPELLRAERSGNIASSRRAAPTHIDLSLVPEIIARLGRGSRPGPE